MTDKYAVIGNPISHTKSPLIHAGFSKATAQDIEYGAILGPLQPAGAFAHSVRAFAAAGGRGMNVTAPFKLLAHAMADERSERARLAGAVNALKFEGGRILADNFDGVGLVNDIQRNLGLAMAGKRVLMLGAGGAARGALLPFLQQGPAELVLANRHADKALALVQQLQAQALAAGGGGDSGGGSGGAGHVTLRGCGYADIGAGHFDLVVNATSASLTGELPPVSPSVFAPDGLAYELVYGKGLTPFLKLAHQAGVTRIADGVGMLVEQAAEAFAWWRGVRPDTRAMIQQLTLPLA